MTAPSIPPPMGAYYLGMLVTEFSPAEQILLLEMMMIKARTPELLSPGSEYERYYKRGHEYFRERRRRSVYQTDDNRAGLSYDY